MLSALEWEALSLSLKVACVAVGLSLIPGFAAAWWLARREFRGKALVDGLLHLPLPGGYLPHTLRKPAVRTRQIVVCPDTHEGSCSILLSRSNCL